VADGLRRSSALWQTGCSGGRPLCGRLVVVASVVMTRPQGVYNQRRPCDDGGGRKGGDGLER